MIDLIHGDCLIEMKNIESKSVDMILCDLPYGVTAHKADIVIPFDKLWEQYERIIKDNGAIVLFSQGLFMVDLINSNRKLFRYDLIWDKKISTGFLNANRMPLRVHENILVFYKKFPTYKPHHIEFDGAFKEIKRKPREKKALLKDNIWGLNYGSVKFSIPKVNDDLRHPTSLLNFKKPYCGSNLHRTQKPTDLLEFLIKTYTNDGEIVLDNTMGSGSTGVACLNTNRKFIGIEMDEHYFNVAKQRIGNEPKLITG
jgi:DNA modification methylase